MNTALLLIDIQSEYFPGGKRELKGCIEASLQARRLLDHFRETGQPVIFIQHINPQPGATAFLPGTAAVEIHPNIQPLPGETVIQKNYPNSFRETGLLEHLRQQQVTRLVISGMMTHMCVDTTVRAANDLGFSTLTAGDACATRDLVYEGQAVSADAVQAAFLAALNGMFGKVVRTEQVIAQLMTGT